MTDNAGPPPAAANKDPVNLRRPAKISEGSGSLQQVLDFLWGLSRGNAVQRIAFVVIVLLAAIVAGSIIFVVLRLTSSGLLTVGGTSVIGGGAAWLFTRARVKHLAKAAVDKPRD
ncbi:MAG TPA: hypothetical protein VH333_15795 [Pseudonocardiaceae bacterium]|jgi:hypothetical protein|nr:hypothetical protein [Pseudonocardiaceae bacterium]